MRFALSPDGVVTPDLAERLPGRGAWVTSDRTSIDTAAKKGLFSRAFKQNAAAPADLAASVEALLVKRSLEAIGLAFRAGEAVLGFDKTRALVQKEAPALLIEASDAAADGRTKILALARAAHGRICVIGCFKSDELGLSLGRDSVVHVALRSGAAARRLLKDAKRLSGFRPLAPDSWGLENWSGAEP